MPAQIVIATESQSKHVMLLALARERMATRLDGFKCIGDYHDGRYECEHVSPYTKSANNVNASVAVVLQDWSSDEFLAKAFDAETAELGHKPSLRTNRNLRDLLANTFGLALADTYATNLFPFIKLGEMTARIAPASLRWSAERFTLPEIRIVAPQLVVVLGLSAFNAIRQVSGHKSCRNLDEALASSFRDRGGSQLHCQAHPGGLGTANRNRGGVDRVSRDWTFMAAILRSS